MASPIRSSSHMPQPRSALATPRNRTAIRTGGSGTASPTTGSATQTITDAPSRSMSPEPLILRLRGAHNATSSTSTSPTQTHQRRITWAEDVIDNEGLGRKSSKVCCIYHKTREFGESSDESSSEDSSDSDSDASDSPDDGSARMVGGGRGRRGRTHNHKHTHTHKRRKPSPNAYEKMPNYSVRQQGDVKQ